MVERKRCFLVDENALDANLPVAFCKTGCFVVAMVPVPPAVVCFKWCVFDQCSRSAAVATCSLVGPSAKRSQYFTLSLRLDLVSEDSVVNSRLSDIARESGFVLICHSTFVMLMRLVT